MGCQSVGRRILTIAAAGCIFGYFLMSFLAVGRKSWSLGMSDLRQSIFISSLGANPEDATERNKNSINAHKSEVVKDGTRQLRGVKPDLEANVSKLVEMAGPGQVVDATVAARFPETLNRYVEPQEAVTQKIQKVAKKKDLKYILYWTRYYRNVKDWEFGSGQWPFIKHCPLAKNCFVTSNRTLLPHLKDYHALLFNFWPSHIIEDGILNIPSPSRRSPRQRYVLHAYDPIFKGDQAVKAEEMEDRFNWTFSYRLDSDLTRPYGWLEPHDSKTRTAAPNLKEAKTRTWIEFDNQWVMTEAKQKTGGEKRANKFAALAKRPRLVAWMSSHCPAPSGRAQYVAELANHIDVGTFGKCGNETCLIDTEYKKLDGCLDFINQNFKYYLAFENSFCDHYVSEKFWVIGMQMDLVPIVLGSAKYSLVAPPHSYINIQDFSSPKELAAFILKIERDPVEYLSYFWWRPFYRVISQVELAWLGMCDLCKKLNDPEEPESVVEYDKFAKCEERHTWNFTKPET